MTGAVTGFEPGPLDRDATTYVAGHRGLVGSAIWRRLEAAGFTDLRGRSSSELDLRDRGAVFDFLADVRPRYVVLAAAKVGGILANDTYPVEFLSDNLRIQTNVLDAALEQRVGATAVPRLVVHLPQARAAADPRGLPAHRPARADQRRLRDRQDRRHPRRPGRPPPVRAAVDLGDADQPLRPGRQLLAHRQPRAARPDPAVRRGARRPARPRVTNWGSGTPRREFLHVDDLADACLHLLEHYDGPEQVNVGTGKDVTIREIAGLVGRRGRLRGRDRLGHRASPTARPASCSTSASSTTSAGRPGPRSPTASPRPSRGTASRPAGSARSADPSPAGGGGHRVS